MSRSTGVTLVDLDGVLLPGDTMASVVLTRLKSVPWRAPVALVLVCAALVAPAASRVRPWVNRAIVHLVLRGMTVSAYSELASQTGERLAVQARTELIAELAATDARVVVVTASERTVAEAFLRSAGLGHAEILASQLHCDDRRWRFRWHNYAADKVVAANAADVELARAIFYTDSSSDLSMIREVESTWLVGASRRSRRAIRRGAPQAVLREWPGPDGTTSA
ncbi:haloacid dehalogenase-like hydrolase [Microbacterium keratanolyticum]|uniref:haloacid dehalogenase-like hydrolase n=1 Tax=Microbacterium keratanolyticum TaxID=67574 RepID=UPI0036435290